MWRSSSKTGPEALDVRTSALLLAALPNTTSCVCLRRVLTPQTGAALLEQPSVSDAAQAQSNTAPSGSSATAQAAWNPFDDDDFSNLAAEEIKPEEKKTKGKDGHKYVCFLETKKKKPQLKKLIFVLFFRI